MNLNQNVDNQEYVMSTQNNMGNKEQNNNKNSRKNNEINIRSYLEKNNISKSLVENNTFETELKNKPDLVKLNEKNISNNGGLEPSILLSPEVRH